MALVETRRVEVAERSVAVTRRTLSATVALAASVVGWLVWFGWRAQHLAIHPIPMVAVALEVFGAIAGVAISWGLLKAGPPRTVFSDDDHQEHRFTYAVADLVGRTRLTDVHRDVRLIAQQARARHRPRNSSDFAIAAVLSDGPRRLLLVAVVTLSLLLGVAPMAVPPAWAMIAATAAVMSTSGAHVILGGGRIRVGDRVRYSYAAIGELMSPADHDGLAPRRWVGTVAAVVAVNLAMALRGMSDRWTHGLSPMERESRVFTMMLGATVVLGALYTLCTTPAPDIADAHLMSRRLEERTARQSALGGAVIVGIIGLLAGVLPVRVDTADHDPIRVEQISERDAVDLQGVAGG